MRTPVGLLIGLPVMLSLGCTAGTTYTPASPSPITERVIHTSRWGDILVVCDDQTGNLLYISNSGPVSVVKDGCPKT